MKKELIFKLAATAVAGMMLSMPVSAQQINLTGEVCPLPLAATIGGETTVTELSGLDAIGVKDDHVVVLLKMTAAQADDMAESTAPEGESEAPAQTEAPAEEEAEGELIRVYYVPVADFTDQIPSFDLNSLPTAEETPDLKSGSTGDGVKQLQENLISLGILGGEADGQFGGGTQSAVSQFQTEYGMEANGTADAVTQWAADEIASILSGKAAEPVEYAYPPVYTVEEKFKDIYELTETDLTPFLEKEWKFNYDVFEGIGHIEYSNGTELGTLEQGEHSIDKISLSAHLCVAVIRDEANLVKVTPVIHISTVGAYCPYVQNVQILAGGKLVQAELLNTQRGLSGVDVTEEDNVTLTAEALELLGSDDDLTLRINGTSNTYELNVPGGQTAEFAQAVSGLM